MLGWDHVRAGCYPMTEAEADKTLEYRKANIGDGPGILSVLKEAAPEIPFRTGDSELENIQITIGQCCASGESWVAVDNDTIVGVVLAKPDFREPDFIRKRALSLPYIAVNKASRNQRIFSTLMGKLKARAVPLSASVLATNKSSMAKRLEKIGFTKVESQSTAVEAKFRWTPNVAQPGTKA
jgi:N-acetylglutamate synthase-like GNAT family acetyltransferase